MIRERDSRPNLRLRKRIDFSPGNLKGRQLDGQHEKKLTVTTIERSFVDSSSASPTSHTDGYLLTPLRERSVLTRLDVGPFLFRVTDY